MALNLQFDSFTVENHTGISRSQSSVANVPISESFLVDNDAFTAGAFLVILRLGSFSGCSSGLVRETHTISDRILRGPPVLEAVEHRHPDSVSTALLTMHQESLHP